jgi:hypothetical protein
MSPQPPQDGRWAIFVPAAYKNMALGEAELNGRPSDAAPPFLHVPPRALWFECGPVEKKKNASPIPCSFVLLLPSVRCCSCSGRAPATCSVRKRMYSWGKQGARSSGPTVRCLAAAAKAVLARDEAIEGLSEPSPRAPLPCRCQHEGMGGG